MLPAMATCQCIVTALLLLLVATRIQGECTGDDQMYDAATDICYTVHEELVTHEVATQQCRASESWLARVSSQSINDELETLVALHSVTWAWLGLNKDDSYPAEWMWSDGSLASQQGCYVDSPDDRDLPEQINMDVYDTVTPDRCVNECRTRGKLYAGLQFPDLCFCGDSYGKHGASFHPDPTRCTKKCTGTDYVCGGVNRNTIIAVDGSYSVWGNARPDNVDIEHCAVISKSANFDFEDDTCNLYYPYICDMPLSACSIQPSSDALYYQLNGRCFLVSQNDTGSWHVARNKCVGFGGRLLKMESKEVHDLMKTVLADMYFKHWIGMHRNPHVWSNGDRVTWNNWAHSEPSPSRRCGVMYKYTSPANYMWKGESCTNTASYICAHDPANLPPTLFPPTTTTTTTKTTTTTTTTTTAASTTTTTAQPGTSQVSLTRTTTPSTTTTDVLTTMVSTTTISTSTTNTNLSSTALTPTVTPSRSVTTPTSSAANISDPDAQKSTGDDVTERKYAGLTLLELIVVIICCLLFLILLIIFIVFMCHKNNQEHNKVYPELAYLDARYLAPIPAISPDVTFHSDCSSSEAGSTYGLVPPRKQRSSRRHHRGRMNDSLAIRVQ